MVLCHGHGAYIPFEWCNPVAVGRPKHYEGSWVQQWNREGYSVRRHTPQLGAPGTKDPCRGASLCLSLSVSASHQGCTTSRCVAWTIRAMGAPRAWTGCGVTSSRSRSWWTTCWTLFR
jgi:hypothetical protein